eukprot:CAMPEP_0183503012 /NCGR_PEP_ID=MMETSP0371-20130417/4763_1 /TAXON_ID=268820 /ORGANISM="Peridinium aciculiferum, Strain PAER-2" /LENGTH=97 /DNA_ID=CAMNT_0025697959 /DNA_START=88 /DNA_END=378 /DNA_ORIENTATION=+
MPPVPLNSVAAEVQDFQKAVLYLDVDPRNSGRWEGHLHLHEAPRMWGKAVAALHQHLFQVTGQIFDLRVLGEGTQFHQLCLCLHVAHPAAHPATVRG